MINETLSSTVLKLIQAEDARSDIEATQTQIKAWQEDLKSARERMKDEKDVKAKTPILSTINDLKLKIQNAHVKIADLRGPSGNYA